MFIMLAPPPPLPLAKGRHYKFKKMKVLPLPFIADDPEKRNVLILIKALQVDESSDR